MNLWDIQNLIINRKKQKSYNSGWISSSVWGWLSTIQSVTGVGVEQQIVIWKTRSVWQLRDIQQPMSHNIKTPDSCRKYYWPSHYNEMFCSDNQGSAPSLPPSRTLHPCMLIYLIRKGFRKSTICALSKPPNSPKSQSDRASAERTGITPINGCPTHSNPQSTKDLLLNTIHGMPTSQQIQ